MALRYRCRVFDGGDFVLYPFAGLYERTVAGMALIPHVCPHGIPPRETRVIGVLDGNYRYE